MAISTVDFLTFSTFFLLCHFRRHLEQATTPTLSSLADQRYQERIAKERRRCIERNKFINNKSVVGLTVVITPALLRLVAPVAGSLLA